MVYRHSWTIQKKSIVSCDCHVVGMQTYANHSQTQPFFNDSLCPESPQSSNSPRKTRLRDHRFRKPGLPQKIEAQLMVDQPPDFGCANHWVIFQ